MSKKCPYAPRKNRKECPKYNSICRPKKEDGRYGWSFKGITIKSEYKWDELFRRYELLETESPLDYYYVYECLDTTLRVKMIQKLDDIKENRVHYLGIECLDEYIVMRFVYSIHEYAESIQKEMNDRSLI